MTDVYNECEYESRDEHAAHKLQDRDPYLTKEQALKKVQQQREDDRGWDCYP